MTILLYDYVDLEERTSSRLRVWKAWHTIIYALAAVFGIMNFIFLQNAKEMVDGNCVFYPRQLEFHWIQKITYADFNNTDQPVFNTTSEETVESIHLNDTNAGDSRDIAPEDNKNNATADKRYDNDTIEQEVENNSTEVAPTNDRVRRNAQEFTETKNVTTVESRNATFIHENTTHRLVLDLTRTLFAKDSHCQFAEYMPILSTVFAIAWCTLFIMCPGGGRVRSGLQQPWRILAPALLFAIAMVGLTGDSFVKTNGGLQAFCGAFHNYTNTTTCSAVDPMLESAWNATWGMGGRVSATRAASAGVWALWAVAAALMLARCLAAPDFVVRRTGVYLIEDPRQKVTPFLQKSSARQSQRSNLSSPARASIKSEPTITTELVTASIEQGPESEPTSLSSSPVKIPHRTEPEVIEMTHTNVLPIGFKFQPSPEHFH